MRRDDSVSQIRQSSKAWRSWCLRQSILFHVPALVLAAVHSGAPNAQATDVALPAIDGVFG